MLFLTLLFIFISAYSLIKGKILYNYGIQNAQYEIDKAKGSKEKPSQEFVAQGRFIFIFCLFYIISLIIYVIKALHIDPLLYPTITLVGLIMINFISVLSAKKKDLSTDEGRTLYLLKVKKKRSFNGFVQNLIYLVYFTYMFLVLVDLIK